MSKTTTALARVEANEYAIAQADLGEIREVIEENLGGSQINITQLDRIKVPSGGSQQWEIPTLDTKNPDYQKTFEGIVVYWRDQRGMWIKSLEDSGSGAPPDCQGAKVEIDAIGHRAWRGRGIRWEGDSLGPHDCETCPFNEFGSDTKGGRGKQCKEVKLLAILTQDSVLPTILSVPSTSLKNVNDFFRKLAGKGKKVSRFVLSFGLFATANKGGTKYSEVVLSVSEELGPEMAAKIRDYSEQIRPILETAATFDAPKRNGAASAGSSFAEEDPEPTGYEPVDDAEYEEIGEEGDAE